MAFDPDQYLAGKSSEKEAAFDPDAYLRETESPATSQFSVPTKENIAESQKQARRESMREERKRPFAGSVLEKPIGAGEALLSTATGSVAGLGGILSGLYQTRGKYGTPEGVKEAEQIAAETAKRYTYEPRTTKGQEYTEQAGKVLGELPGLTPAMGSIEAAAASRFAPAAARQASAAARQVTQKVKESPVTQAAQKAGQAVVGKVGEYTIGATQPETARQAKYLEGLGFELEPVQLRKDKPLGSPGFRESSRIKNENLATKLASKETGVETENVTPAYLKTRVEKIGKEYDKIFGRKFDIDTELVKKLDDIRKFEEAVTPSGTGKAQSIAGNIIKRWDEASKETRQKAIENRIRTIMQQQQRGGVSPITRLKKDWPTIRDGSAPDLPTWFADVESTVTELSNNLGLRVTPKVWVSKPRREGRLFGMATGDGNIIINDALDLNGAVATALHEFGHQAEFQLFAQAPVETRKAVVSAFEDQRRAIKPGTLTVEQYRPLTAEKYGESRKQIPSRQYERGYLQDFSEWFAEQTSRWITETKAPTDLVEKFFAKIADSWKKIYQRVVGYVPLVKEVDDFFRSNWKGDLLETAYKESAEPSAGGIEIPTEKVTAKIDGAELQRLRTSLTNIARNASDGQVRRTAGEFVSAIDEAIGRYDPQLLERLRTANRQYAAASVLSEGIEKGFVEGGKVGLQGLGNHLANNTYGFGSGTSSHPLYDLGYAGRAVKLRTREEGVQFPSSGLAELLARGRISAATALGLRSQLARDLQRAASEKELRRMIDEQEKQRREP